MIKYALLYTKFEYRKLKLQDSTLNRIKVLVVNGLVQSKAKSTHWLPVNNIVVDL